MTTCGAELSAWWNQAGNMIDGAEAIRRGMDVSSLVEVPFTCGRECGHHENNPWDLHVGVALNGMELQWPDSPIKICEFEA